jgi:hypothetical protein
MMTERRFVPDLPDLIAPADYAGDPGGRRVRLRIGHSDQGVEILGDAMRVQELERLLAALESEAIEQMLCG